MNSTYSFSDIIATFSHPGVGLYIASGEGVGSLNISMSTDRTVHDVAADGSVMVSKIRARNGNMTITAQQTSALHKWLTKWFNFIESAPASAWADMSITVKAIVMGETKTFIGVAPQKQGDVPYQAQGQQITWTLMSSDVQQDAF